MRKVSGTTRKLALYLCGLLLIVSLSSSFIGWLDMGDPMAVQIERWGKLQYLAFDLP